MDKRTWLINEIEKISPRDTNNSEGIADFILARDKKNAEPLVNWKKEKHVAYTVSSLKAIDATLTNLGVESKERV